MLASNCSSCLCSARINNSMFIYNILVFFIQFLVFFSQEVQDKSCFEQEVPSFWTMMAQVFNRTANTLCDIYHIMVPTEC